MNTECFVGWFLVILLFILMMGMALAGEMYSAWVLAVSIALIVGMLPAAGS